MRYQAREREREGESRQSTSRLSAFVPIHLLPITALPLHVDPTSSSYPIFIPILPFPLPRICARPLLSSPSTTRLGGYSAVSRNRTRNVSKEAMYRQRNDSPLLARSFSCLSHSVSASHPPVRLFDTHFIVNQYYAVFRNDATSIVYRLWKNGRAIMLF